MYTPKAIDTNFDFPVIREPWNLSNGNPTNLEALYRGDTGKFLSAVTPSYKLTTHKEAADFTEALFNKQNLKFEVGKTFVAFNGRKFYREYRFPDMKFTPGEGNVNQTALDGAHLDDYHPLIIIKNSYDRTSTFEFTYGVYRLICTNGMISYKADQRISVKHNRLPDFDSIGNVVLDRIEATVEGFKRSYDRLNSSVADIYANTIFLEVLSKRLAGIAEGLSKGLIVLDKDKEGVIQGVKVNPQLSAYALYQILTDIASHNIQKYNKALELQTRIASTFGVY